MRLLPSALIEALELAVVPIAIVPVFAGPWDWAMGLAGLGDTEQQ